MMEDYTQALECYRESIPMDAPQANTYTLMGECMERMGKLNEATDYYQCALELDGEFADAHVGLGVVAEMRQEGQPASNASSVRWNWSQPTSSTTCCSVASSRKSGCTMKGLDGANALRLEPQNLEVYLEAAANLQAAECHEDALEMLQEVPEASQSDPLVVAHLHQPVQHRPAPVRILAAGHRIAFHPGFVRNCGRTLSGSPSGCDLCALRAEHQDCPMNFLLPHLPERTRARAPMD